MSQLEVFNVNAVNASFKTPSKYKGTATRVSHHTNNRPPQKAKNTKIVPVFTVGKSGSFALKHKKFNTLYAFECNAVHANLVVLKYKITSPKGPITGSMCVVRRREGLGYNLMANVKEPATHTQAFVSDFHQIGITDLTPVMYDGSQPKVNSRTVAEMIIGLTLHAVA